MAGTSRLWATADGAHWHGYWYHCPANYTENGLAGIAAASRSRVRFLCPGDAAAGSQRKAVLVSVNGGRTTRLAGIAPTGGTGGVIAAPPGSPSVISLATVYYLDRSADGGRTWTGTLLETGGLPWTYLAYLSPTTGWAAGGDAIYGALWKTTDTGRTWYKVTF